MEDVKISYAAAEVFPAKLLTHERLIKSCRKGRFIPPLHIQLNPTNKCNFSCPMCSCSARDRGLELGYEEIMETMRTAKELGCESCTITGGGEPLMHEKINEIIDGIRDLGILAGLVTNGTLLDRVKTKTLNRLTWARVSSSDFLADELEWAQKNLDGWFEGVRCAVERGWKVDWAFSHVLSENPDLDLIGKLVVFANGHNFTHVRIVGDIFIAEKLEGAMEAVKSRLRGQGVDDSRVNYQSRAAWARGTKECYISLLKPVLAADGHWLACCGIQYAFPNPARDYEKRGWITDKRLLEGLRDIVENQRCFDGSGCIRCYYDNYNWALKVLLSEIRHPEFV